MHRIPQHRPKLTFVLSVDLIHFTIFAANCRPVSRSTHLNTTPKRPLPSSSSTSKRCLKSPPSRTRNGNSDASGSEPSAVRPSVVSVAIAVAARVLSSASVACCSRLDGVVCVPMHTTFVGSLGSLQPCRFWAQTRKRYATPGTRSLIVHDSESTIVEWTRHSLFSSV